MWVTQRGPQAAHQGGQRDLRLSAYTRGRGGSQPPARPRPDHLPPTPSPVAPSQGQGRELEARHPAPYSLSPDSIQAPSPQSQPQEHLITSWVARTLKGAECPLTSRVRREVGAGGQKQVGEASHDGTGQRS